MIIYIICSSVVILIIAGIWLSRLPKVEKALQIFSRSTTPRTEITSCFGLKRIEMTKHTTDVNSPSAVVKDKPIILETKKQIVEIRSHQVGFFYLTFETEGKPFVELGQKIKKGDDVGLIVCNYLKIADRVKSEVDGIVAEILIEDGQPVGYDQVLMRIEIK